MFYHPFIRTTQQGPQSYFSHVMRRTREPDAIAAALQAAHGYHAVKDTPVPTEFPNSVLASSQNSPIAKPLKYLPQAWAFDKCSREPTLL
jgi:hypothetical protein